MSKQIIDWIGPCPSEEECAQTTQDDFHEKNRAECKRFKELIEKIYPPLENSDGQYTYVKVHVETGHDFGNYREVVLMMETSISEEQEEKISEWVGKIQDLPGTWNELEEMAKGK